ncbi:MAG: acyltransferase family protein [Thermoleophilaceae bacterium]
MAQSAQPRTRVRPEIQALRAIAVSVVVMYHFWPKILPGGFVGVDVFFVISGFLITTQLLREVDRTGRVSMPAFWARRARRILPAALVVLLFCAVATAMFVPINYWEQFFGDMRASTFYGQNWHLAAAAVDYSASQAAPSIVQHYWSLSVEEQFYLVWPVLILLAVGFARIRNFRASRRTIAVALFALTAVSLAYGVYDTNADPVWAYFVTPTRAWEFAVGGLLALLPAVKHSRPAVASAFAWLGIVAIAVAAIGYTDATPFPGTAALLPVLGATLFIRCEGPIHRFAPTRPLELRPVQFVGDISYAVYLWHWPLLILAPFVIAGKVHTNVKVTLLMLTLVAAWLTKIVVEDPVRSGRFLTRRRPRWTLGFAAAASLAVLAVMANGDSRVQAQIHRDAQVAAHVLHAPPRCFGAASRDPQHRCVNSKLARMVVPTPVDALNRPNSPCDIQSFTTAVLVCTFGVAPQKATTTIALVGDSHASHWRAALDVVAHDRHWRGLSVTRSGCAFSNAIRVLHPPLGARCVKRNHHELPQWFARHPEISTVFVTEQSGVDWVVPHGRSALATEAAGFAAAWRSLPSTVKHVIVLRDSPKNRATTAACVQRAIAKHRNAGIRCAVPRGAAVDTDPAIVAANQLHSARVRTIDMTRYFCDSRRCWPVIGGALVHKDNHHLTVVFARTLGPYLERAVNAILPRRPH